jgi:hypothetical protein
MIELAMIGALLTSMMILMVWSWLYRQNVFYAFAEHTVVGIAAGYACVVGITNLNKLALQPIAAGKDYTVIIPIALGLLLFARYSRKIPWVSNYGMALIIGAGIGIAMRTVMEAQVLRQIIATIPLLAKPLGMDLFNGIVLVVAMVTTVTYFIYSRNTEARWEKARWQGGLQSWHSSGTSTGALYQPGSATLPPRW